MIIPAATLPCTGLAGVVGVPVWRQQQQQQPGDHRVSRTGGRQQKQRCLELAEPGSTTDDLLSTQASLQLQWQQQRCVLRHRAGLQLQWLQQRLQQLIPHVNASPANYADLKSTVNIIQSLSGATINLAPDMCSRALLALPRPYRLAVMCRPPIKRLAYSTIQAEQPSTLCCT